METTNSRTSDADVPIEWNIGDVILDLYEVKGILGEGGMGKVYKVHHKNWSLDLAVKTPRPEVIALAGGQENFVREAETWVNLGLHPHIVSCYYVRNLAGIPRVFAEYLGGGSLHDWIYNRKIYEGGHGQALAQMLDIAIQFAWGLNYAHEQGLIHQDVKPANVMMTPDGTVKVTDFGLAKARVMAGEAGKASAGQSILVSAGGMTPAYCSPEQAAIQPLSRKTDIWSWGLSILEMFTGGVTWMAGQGAMKALTAYLNTQSKDGIITPMPRKLADLLKRCFQKKLELRPATLSEISSTLKAIYEQEVGHAYPRQEPDAVKLLADDLNNRALSMLDLGKHNEAEKSWEEALKLEADHPETIYNHGLWQWRSIQITDYDLVQRMKQVSASHSNDWMPNYLLGLIHLERGDCDSAISILRNIYQPDANMAEVRATLAIAQDRRKQSRRLLSTLNDHIDDVASVCLSNDGSVALSGGEDGTLRVWDVTNSRSLWVFKAHRAILSFAGQILVLIIDFAFMLLTRKSSTFGLRTFGGIRSVTLSEDKKHALSGGGDNIVKYWDLVNKKCLQTFRGHKADVNSVSLSKDGKYSISGSDDETIKLWDVSTGKCIRTFEGHTSYVKSVCMTKDGKYIFSGSLDNTIKMWSLSTGNCLYTFKGHKHSVNSICLSDDERYILSGSSDKTLILWDIATKRWIGMCTGHTDEVRCVCLSKDGKYALSSSVDHTVRMWDLETGKCIRTFDEHHGQVWSVCMDADGHYALFRSGDKTIQTIKIWNIHQPDTFLAPMMVARRLGNRELFSARVTISRAMDAANKALNDGDSLTAVKQLRVVRSEKEQQRTNETMEKWSQLYLHLPHSSFRDGWIKANLEGHTDDVNAVCLSKDGEYGLSASSDRTIKLWDIAGARCLRTVKVRNERKDELNGDDRVNAVCMGEDWSYVLSGGGNDAGGYPRSIPLGKGLTTYLVADFSLRFWNIAGSHCIRTFEGHTAKINSVCLSKDRRYALSGSADHTIKLWDVATGYCLRTILAHKAWTVGTRSICLSEDDRYVLSGGGDGTLKLWELINGNCLRVFKGHTESVESVCLSSDGNYAISGSRDKTLRLWELQSGHCVNLFTGHTGAVNSVCFSADSRYVLSGSSDKTLKLWDISSGLCLHTFIGHTDEVTSVHLSVDGRFALSGSNDQMVKLWELDWNLEDIETKDWDDGARRYLRNFLTLHTPYVEVFPKDHVPTEDEIVMALTRNGKPVWTEEDFEQLLYKLGSAGYGWLHPNGVRKELERMALEREIEERH